jgi:hypothetical protein
MKEIIINAGFVYSGVQQLPCCRYDVYHKTVNNQLCEVGIAEYKKKFFIKFKGEKRNHLHNFASPIDVQLMYELENNGLLNSVAQ